MVRNRRRRRGRQSGATGSVVFFGGIGVLLLLSLLQYLGQHPEVLLLMLAVALVAASGSAWLIKRRRDAAVQRWAQLTASIAACDGLTGPQFEHWVAALMRRTGFCRVQVCGGAGDLGADIVAVGPGRHRIVVQCKCLRADRAVGSPDIQRFAGTAYTLHHADVAVVVTTGRFSRPAVQAAARLRIALVDRHALAAWAADSTSPAVMGAAR